MNRTAPPFSTYPRLVKAGLGKPGGQLAHHSFERAWTLDNLLREALA
ncbi:hypothetical protein ACVMIH_005193 [Bradyrhizobium sp. USDA 4503]